MRVIKVKGKLAILLISSRPYYNVYRTLNLIEYEDGTLTACEDEEIEYLENEVEE